jgi:hypothetical protein
MDWSVWRRWIATVNAGELVGFTVPLVAGAALANAAAGPRLTYVLVLAAGAVEGWCLGYAQAWALRDHVHALPRRAFAAATAGPPGWRTRWRCFLPLWAVGWARRRSR